MGGGTNEKRVREIIQEEIADAIDLLLEDLNEKLRGATFTANLQDPVEAVRWEAAIRNIPLRISQSEG